MRLKGGWDWLLTNYLVDCREGAEAHDWVMDNLDGQVIAVDLAVWLGQNISCKKQDVATTNKCIETLLARVSKVVISFFSASVAYHNRAVNSSESQR